MGTRSGALGRHDIAVITFNLIPDVNHTFKYERLGPLAVENHRQYCDRHGYAFYDDCPPVAGRHACWAKIPAILQALENHQWVLWADSDALVVDLNQGLEELCDSRYDLVVQCPLAYFKHIGVDPAAALKAMPVNTGVFMVQATAWSRRLLRDAYDRERFVSMAPVWNGIGDQEAITDVLKGQPGDLRRIGYVQALQNHPVLHRKGDLFVHFYGNNARHRLPTGHCEAVLRRWEMEVAAGRPLPNDLALFHWCCIQNKWPDAPLNRGGPERFLYRVDEFQWNS